MKRKDIAEMLKSFWEKRDIDERYFRHEELKLEEEMSKKAGIELEFFYVDGECVGIGAKDWDKRGKLPHKFPLINDSELR
jgi:hypothetical protein